MKLTDGLFHRVFDEIKTEYPDIENEHRIIDIGSAILANRPETLDVVVTLNLYGDIISDIAAEIAGSVGLGGSSNIGMTVSMYEAIHGSAPDIAGQNIANPSGLLSAANMMLVDMGEVEKAEMIGNAWRKTLEDGLHTGDIYSEALSTKKVGTSEFADAIIERLGEKPQKIKAVELNKDAAKISIDISPTVRPEKKLTGVDVFIDWDEDGRNPDILGKKLEDASTSALQLKMITNRGVKVYPDGLPETFWTDHWRCRFINKAGNYVQNQDVIIVPLLSCSGIRIKILEAMSMGKCVLSTSIGAEGIPANDGKEILIADSENEMISCLNALEMDPKRIQEIGHSARNFIKEYFEYKSIMGRVLSAFESFLNEKRDIH